MPQTVIPSGWNGVVDEIVGVLRQPAATDI
jgi:hypothetical protein